METNKKTSFVFYESFKEAASHLDVNDKVEIYEAIINYGLDGTEPEFTKKYLNAVWVSIKIDIDGATKKWNKQKENGMKGGRPKKAITSYLTPPTSKVEQEVKQTEKVVEKSEKTAPDSNKAKLERELRLRVNGEEDIKYFLKLIQDGSISTSAELIEETKHLF